MKSFSQRKGFKPVAEIIQINSMNSELRNSLWNVLYMEIWSLQFIPERYAIEPFSKALWFNLFQETDRFAAQGQSSNPWRNPRSFFPFRVV